MAALKMFTLKLTMLRFMAFVNRAGTHFDDLKGLYLFSFVKMLQDNSFRDNFKKLKGYIR
jgi:hypothetical protein